MKKSYISKYMDLSPVFVTCCLGAGKGHISTGHPVVACFHHLAEYSSWRDM
jgi:hypothetical protein